MRYLHVLDIPVVIFVSLNLLLIIIECGSVARGICIRLCIWFYNVIAMIVPESMLNVRYWISIAGEQGMGYL